jgi:5-methyltetrahydropteroyltriglutamate--homocysteine methyltransferase
MKSSSERILTTHVGSLPRPDDLWAMMQARAGGGGVDDATFARRVQAAVKDCVRHQVETGLDVITDGEMGKPSFITYASQRLAGLEPGTGERPNPFANSREQLAFP